ncbi:MAG: FtsW/RodA/SpoVE family cell cycle protein [Candidatus Nealsonbacteria bacterium]|nr:FtsW/RodA/SpoVE family cell cycle protein [Candidatus Nealsonbacteria bacterium]
MKPADLARRLPWSIVVIAGLLVLLGLAGIARYDELVGGSGRLLRQQIVWSILALAAITAASLANYRRLWRLSYPVFALMLVLLAVAFLFPPIHHAHRWIRVGPVGFQPSEFAKLAYVLALARYLMYRDNYRRLRGLVVPLALTVVPVLLILKEPDLGTATVFLPVFFVMLFAAGARRADLAKIVAVGLLLLPLLWTQMSREQKSRITALFDQPAPGTRPSDDAYHLYQAKRMTALGGTWGSFFTGQTLDDPAVYHLPEARSDFIFCVLSERFGMPGMAAVLTLFGLLVWRMLTVAAATREPFGRLMTAGFAALLAVEVSINTAMTVGLLPITGLSLPLVSHGGSGMLAHAIALGLVISVGLRPGYEVTGEPFRYVGGE